MRRALLAALLVCTGLALGYGYSVTRQERIYRQLLAQGDGALVRGDTFTALGAYSDAIGLKPDAMVGFLKRGETHRRRGELEEAAADLTRAAGIDPGSPLVHELLGDVQAARELHGAAARHYEASVRLDDRPRVLYKLGLARHVAGNTAGAADVLGSAVALDGRFAEAHYLLGVCLRALGRPQEAEASLKRALTLAPRLLAAREELASLYEASGRRAAQIRELERLAADSPEAPRQVALALAYAGSGQTLRAVRLLESVEERHPGYSGAYLALGRLWLDAARRDSQPGHVELTKAIDALEHAVAMEPSGAALGQLALAHLTAGDLDAATEALRRAASMLPADPDLLLRLADTAARADRLRVARDALVQYSAVADPTERSSAVTVRIGDLSVQLDEPEVAARWYGEAASDPLAPASVHVKLAEAQWRTGDAGTARETLRRVLERDPRHSGARALLARLPPGPPPSSP